MSEFDIRKYLGVFESFLVFSNFGTDKKHQIIAFSKHLERFAKGAKFLGLRTFSRDEIKESIINSCTPFDYDEVIRIRLVNVNSDLETYAESFNFKDANFLAKVVFTNAERSLPEIKSTSVAASIYARMEAEKKGSYESLLIDQMNYIREGAWTNIFWLDSNHKWNTPKTRILKGISRELIFDYFRASKQPSVLEEDSELNYFLSRAEAVFLTNSIIGAVPVIQIGDKNLPLFEHSRLLCSQFNEYRLTFLESI